MELPKSKTNRRILFLKFGIGIVAGISGYLIVKLILNNL